MPGVIDSENGIALTGGALTYIQEEPVEKVLSEKYGVPVWIGNDAKCAGSAEVGYGALKDVQDSVAIILGTGIGGCLIKDKKVPILELAYPTTRNDLINVIARANDFLKNLTSINGIVNEDNLDADLKKHEGSLDYKEFKKILDDLIYY